MLVSSGLSARIWKIVSSWLLRTFSTSKRYKEYNGCQKNRQYLRNLDLEVYCANIQPKLTKLRSSTKNQSFLMASVGFLKFLQYCLNVDKFLAFFWPPTPLCWQFEPYKSLYFWTTYPPLLVNIWFGNDPNRNKDCYPVYQICWLISPIFILIFHDSWYLMISKFLGIQLPGPKAHHELHWLSRW